MPDVCRHKSERILQTHNMVSVQLGSDTLATSFRSDCVRSRSLKKEARRLAADRELLSIMCGQFASSYVASSGLERGHRSRDDPMRGREFVFVFV